LRTLSPGFDPIVVAAIDARLDAVQREHHATVLLAIESGSRAWGFPSPDYYLTLYPPRDVIEFPLEGTLDINGWDLGKALRLLLKGNAVVIEWLTSPYAYAGDAEFREEALALAKVAAHQTAIARHYMHLGERQRRTYFADERAVEIKKLFYALRPAIALRWLRLHPGTAVAPMNFPTLVVESELPAEVTTIVRDLLARKAVTRELGLAPLPAPIATLIDEEFAAAREHWPEAVAAPEPAAVKGANELFQRWIDRQP
jgi:uncharacterized protein